MAVSRVYRAIMKFAQGKNGWSEKHWLVATTYADSVTDFDLIIASRLKILCADCSMVDGGISVAGGGRDREEPTTALPAVGLASTAVPAVAAFVNNPDDGVRIKLKCIIGGSSVEVSKIISHYVRGIPDDLVQEKTLGVVVSTVFTPFVLADYAIPAVSGGPPGTFTPNAGATWANRVGNYIATLQTKTTYASRLPDLAGAPPTVQFTVAPWTGRGTPTYGKKRVGRPFGLSVGHAPVR